MPDPEVPRLDATRRERLAALGIELLALRGELAAAVDATPSSELANAPSVSANARLWVSGIDAWPGTPVLDIKGYAPRDDLRHDATVPTWLETLWSAHDAERG